MSEEIELQDMSQDLQQGEESNNVHLSRKTPPKKTGPCNSTIVHYRCAVVCLGVLCAVLAISIRVMWLKTTSEIHQIHSEHNHQLQLLQTTCKNFTQVTSFDNSEIATDCSILSREKSQLETNYNTLSREKSLLATNYNTLSREKSLLETNYNTLSREKSLLETNYCALSCDKLQTRIKITQHAVDVTLDPDTADNHLILSADRKQVKHGDTSQNRPDNPKRFDPIIIVLSKQGFSSGRFYYEVQVSGKTGWIIGVARESVNRKGFISYSPTNGYWAIWLRDSQYMALAGPAVTLSLKERPERVGVFVDYGAGLVSFYDADRWSLIYSYNGVSFTEKIYPYFSPGLNDNGKNSAPLVITPVSCYK